MMTEKELIVAKLKVAAEEYIKAAIRPVNRALTLIELARRNHWANESNKLFSVADMIVADDLTVGLSKGIEYENERTVRLENEMKGLKDG